MAKKAGVLARQHRSIKTMIPSFNIPTSVSLPNATSIPSIPYQLPSFDIPRWVPIVLPLDEPAMMQEPKVAPSEEEVKEEPKEEIKPPVASPPVIPIPPLPPIIQEQPVIPQTPEVITEQPLSVELPFIGELPVPSTEVLITAGTTAAVAGSVSVVAAVGATASFNYLSKAFQSILKFVFKKILKRKNRHTVTWARRRRSVELYRHKQDR